MRILAVTSWGGACGIANYAEMLIEAVGQVDPSIAVEPCAAGLDPGRAGDMLWRQPGYFDTVWLNYHRGLHSRWTPEVLQAIKTHGAKVVITFHDTYGERPPDDLAQQLHDLADAFVVHEPCMGLEKQILIRQGVPAALEGGGWEYGLAKWGGDYCFKAYMSQPILATVGFNFPWKNFDRLAEVTAEAGWAYLILSNNATDADAARWKAANPYTLVVRGFQPTKGILNYLANCDATCFPYECANSGTSGAIRLGLAARKPVLAFEGCRQFRDLQQDTAASQFITWCGNFEYLGAYLGMVPIQRVDPGIAYLAHRDSWANQGKRYAEIFRGVAG